MPLASVPLRSLALATLQSPLARAVAQAVAISAAANVVAQLLSAHHHRHDQAAAVDAGKFARFLTIAVVMAPLNYGWQALLERTFPAERPARAHVRDTPLRDHGGGGESGAHLLGDGDPAGARNGDEEGMGLQGGTAADGGGASGGRQALKLYIWHTFLKWFVDCFLLGTWWNVVLFLILNGALRMDSGLEVMRSVKVETVPIVLNAFKIWPFVMVVGLTLLPMEKRIVFYSAVNFFWGIYMSLVAGREP